jgi:hypothetical protein
LHAAEHNLGDRLVALGERSDGDLASLLHMLDALVPKKAAQDPRRLHQFIFEVLAQAGVIAEQWRPT